MVRKITSPPYDLRVLVQHPGRSRIPGDKSRWKAHIGAKERARAARRAGQRTYFDRLAEALQHDFDPASAARLHQMIVSGVTAQALRVAFTGLTPEALRDVLQSYAQFNQSETERLSGSSK